MQVDCDVLVAGGGNAALCAAITAAERGARVAIFEAAPQGLRGGNSRHTRNLRAAHEQPTALLTDSYTEDEYLADLMAVTGGHTDEHLARLAIRESRDLGDWLHARGVRFQKALGGTLSLGRTNPFFLGGGRALLNALYRHAEKLGIEVAYHAEVCGLDFDGPRLTAVRVRERGFERTVTTRALVAASGGFQANIDWLKSAWGPAAENFLIRGTPYAKGSLLRALLDAGMQPVGEADQCHAVAIDARAPRFDGGIATRLDCVPFSIVVNREGHRFHDEGEDFWPKRYAIWGRLVAAQPDQVGYSILDSQALEDFMPSIFPPEVSDTLEGLADKLGLDRVRLRATVDAFNTACGQGPFDPTQHDGLRTHGLTPDKTNWARRIDRAPFYGYPLRPGITFTYLGLRVDDGARVLTADGGQSGNIWAAGEIMAGNILGKGYLAGIGMTIGSVFGRIAGREAASHVGC